MCLRQVHRRGVLLLSCGIQQRPEGARTAAMASVDHLRQFVSDRLAAAAEEILGVFHKAIVEYEAEIDRHRKLLDVVREQDLKLCVIGECVDDPSPFPVEMAWHAVKLFTSPSLTGACNEVVNLQPEVVGAGKWWPHELNRMIIVTRFHQAQNKKINFIRFLFSNLNIKALDSAALLSDSNSDVRSGEAVSAVVMGKRKY